MEMEEKERQSIENEKIIDDSDIKKDKIKVECG